MLKINHETCVRHILLYFLKTLGMSFFQIKFNKFKMDNETCVKTYVYYFYYEIGENSLLYIINLCKESLFWYIL